MISLILKICIISNLLTALTLSSTVTFYVDHEVQQPLDYVQISAYVKSKSQSLDAAINDAAKIIQNIQKLVDNYCESYTPFQQRKTVCHNMVEFTPYNIKPQYQLFKKKQIFGGFFVTHQIFIRVKQSQNFGQLVDNILKIGVSQINSLQWKPLQQIDGQQQAVRQGYQKAKQICKKLGANQFQILSIEQVTDFGETNKNEDIQIQDQAQNLDISDEITYYKFVVDCQIKKI